MEYSSSSGPRSSLPVWTHRSVRSPKPNINSVWFLVRFINNNIGNLPATSTSSQHSGIVYLYFYNGFSFSQPELEFPFTFVEYSSAASFCSFGCAFFCRMLPNPIPLAFFIFYNLKSVTYATQQ